MQTALIVVAVAMTIISVTSGVNKGLRVLSEINIYVSVGLMLFILFLGNTEFLLNAFVQNIGDYINRFPEYDFGEFCLSTTERMDEQLDILLLGMVVARFHHL